MITLPQEQLQQLKMYSGDSNEKDMPDADMFIKSQDWDEDWNQITVLHSEFDAVCTNVYIAFGKTRSRCGRLSRSGER
jgi:hypothetical protein